MLEDRTVCICNKLMICGKCYSVVSVTLW